MAEPTNQIRITLALQGQAQVQAGLQQTARQTTAVGASAAGIEAELAAVTARLQAMGAAAAIATQQLQRVQLEQAGLGTTSDSAAQRLRRQQDETTGLGTASAGAGKQVGTLAAAVRGAVAGFGVLGLVQVAQQISAVGLEFDALRGRIDKTSNSSQQGAARFAFVTAEADRLGVAVRDTADNYADFLGATRSQGYSDAKRDNIFSALNEASAAYNLTQQQTNQNFDQLNRIAGKGKITLDDLAGSLGTNLPQTLDALALGLGVSNGELKKMIADGQLAGRDVLPALAEGFRQTFGTDTRTQIQGTAADIQALKNQLLLTADALAKQVNPAVGSFSRNLSDEIRIIREDFAGYLKLRAQDVGRGVLGELGIRDAEGSRPLAEERIRARNLAADYVKANPFRPQLYDPNRRAPEPFFGPGRPAPDTLIGERLLSFGTPDAKARKAAEREAQRELNEALREQKRIEAELQRGREASLKSAVDEEATRLGLIRSARTQAAVIEEELRTGQALTGAARELFELKQDTTKPVDAMVEKELQHLAALEAQVKAIKDGDRAAQQARSARERADRSANEFLRQTRGRFDIGPGQEDRDPFGRLDRKRDAQTSELDQRFNAARDANNAAVQADPENADDYYQRDLELAAAHAEAKKKIDADYVASNRGIYASMTSGAAAVFGQLSDLAAGFGEKGFRAAKAFSIAQALLKIPEAASNAYASAASVPGIGYLLAPVAAAAAVAIQVQRVADIRRQQPPGRRFGGPVSAGQPYELAESGTTEFFRDAKSGRKYLIPGNSGEVTPAQPVSGSAGGGNGRVQLQLVVNNTLSDRVRVRAQPPEPGLNGRQVVRLMVEELADPGGPINRGLSSRSGRPSLGEFG